MLVEHMRHKRRRSPSPGYDDQHPEAELPSPLDVLVKRRRRQQPGDMEGGEVPSPSYFHYDPNQAETSSTPYVERRRAKQWDRLNAPRPSLPNQVQSQPHLDFTPPHPTAMSRSYSQPFHQTLHSSPPHAHSQPVPQHLMSSSPIRHQPFGSSPFKSQSSNLIATPIGLESSDSATRVEVQTDFQVDQEDDMDPDEMRRSWGEQYAQQNELLHSVHRQRVIQRHQATFDTSVLQTPLPYRDSYFASSPYHPPSSTRSRRSTDSAMMDTDDTMNDHSQTSEHDPLITTRYEHANQLLAELELVRRQRWGT